MADPDKTEKATPKRQGEARKKGQVAKSTDLNSVVGLLAAFAALSITGPHMIEQLEAVLTRGLAQAGDTQLATVAGLSSLAWWAMTSFAAVLAPVVFAALGAGMLANIAQVRFRFTMAPMKPTFSKLNPGKGLKRLFGPSGLVETCKAVTKLTIVGGTAFMTVWPRLPTLGALTGIPPAMLLGQLGGQVMSIVVRVGALLLVLAVADWFWQRHKLAKSLKMTKAEVKQEARQSDLAPELRGAIKRKQYQQAKRRMLSEIPSADVVVVNPTHYAVALRYDGTTPAPELVAKGADHIAAAIRAAAKEHGIPIVSNPPLARTIYGQVEIGSMIPEELFGSVAEVLAYVYRIAGRRTRAARRPSRAIAQA
jgi:flagellar biosynthetic protein FlhB